LASELRGGSQVEAPGQLNLFAVDEAPDCFTHSCISSFGMDINHCVDNRIQGPGVGICKGVDNFTLYCPISLAVLLGLGQSLDFNHTSLLANTSSANYATYDEVALAQIAICNGNGDC
jgi:hypothetical protein